MLDRLVHRVRQQIEPEPEAPRLLTERDDGGYRLEEAEPAGAGAR
jgi:DNA-binding response OmpR family regulator